MSKENKAGLSQTLSLLQMVLYGVGTILGAGIYALIGKIAGASGVFAPISFFISALLAGLTGYSYAQLVNRYPKSAGEAEYVFQGFKNRSFANLIGWLVVLTGVVSGSAMVIAFAGYFQSFFDVNFVVIVIIVVSILTLVSILGIELSVNVFGLLTCIEVFGLLLILSSGYDAVIDKNFLIDEIIFQLKPGNMSAILSGSFLAFYAFIGFEDIVNLAEEVKYPKTTIPKAIYISIFISTLLYIMVALVAVASMPIDQLQRSKVPLAEMYASFGGNPLIISAIALFAILNSVLAQILMASRVLYGLNHPFKILNKLSDINPKTKTPIKSTLFIAFMFLFLIFNFDLKTLASMTSFIILIVFSFINLSLIVIEHRCMHKNHLNYIIPAMGIVLNISLIFFNLTQ